MKLDCDRSRVVESRQCVGTDTMSVSEVPDTPFNITAANRNVNSLEISLPGLYQDKFLTNYRVQSCCIVPPKQIGHQGWSTAVTGQCLDTRFFGKPVKKPAIKTHTKPTCIVLFTNTFY